jgi:tetratricopeptide (TPR) repeat protein
MTERSIVSMLVLMLAGSVMLGCGGSSAAAETTTPQTEPASSSNNGGEHAGTEAYIARGMSLLGERRCEEAIRLGFDPAIAEFERSFEPGTRVIGSRTGGASALLLLVTAASDGRNAVVIDAQYSDAIYMRAYCLVELGRVPEAAQALQRALEIIPDDVAYSCELGNIMQERREWAPSLEIYRRALANVDALDSTGAFNGTPEYPTGLPILGLTLTDWRRRAMRGVGFSLIEVGDLDGAETMFRRVLEIDPNDERALSELAFIAERRREAH